MNFKNYKFRASQIGHLMTPTRGKSNLEKYNDLVAKRDDFQVKHDKIRDGLKSKENYRIKIEDLNKEIEDLEPYKDVVILSSTAKKYLHEIFIAEKYDRRKEIFSKYLDKGNYAEEDSLTLATDVRGELYVKNLETLKNDYITGTPDVIDEIIRDIKTKWDIWGFMEEDGSNMLYYWQLQSYMWLADKEKAELIYTLVDTPQHLIFSEYTKALHTSGFEDGSEEMLELEAQIEKNMTYEDIEKKERIKSFDFFRSESDIEQMKRYIKQAREYLNTLSLN